MNFKPTNSDSASTNNPPLLIFDKLDDLSPLIGTIQLLPSDEMNDEARLYFFPDMMTSSPLFGIEPNVTRDKKLYRMKRRKKQPEVNEIDSLVHDSSANIVAAAEYKLERLQQEGISQEQSATEPSNINIHTKDKTAQENSIEVKEEEESA